MDKTQIETLLARIDVWLLIFGVVVVVGVAGESFFGIRHWWNSRKLQTIQRTEEQQHEEEIARLNQEAARLRKETEDERLARVEMEEALAPRRLNRDQRRSIVAALQSFNGEYALLEYLIGDREAEVFSLDVWAALHEAKWRITSPGGILSVRELSPGTLALPVPLEQAGISLQPTADDGSQRAAKALRKEFETLGFDCSIGKTYAGREFKQGVEILVTTRPLGPQGEAKLRAEAKKRQDTSSQTAKP